jgi:hypothetical protein
MRLRLKEGLFRLVWAVSGLLACAVWPCHCFGAGEQHMASIALPFPTLSLSYQPFHWPRLMEGPDLRQFE